MNPGERAETRRNEWENYKDPISNPFFLILSVSLCSNSYLKEYV